MNENRCLRGKNMVVWRFESRVEEFEVVERM